jgi:hypothetical protein
VRVVADERTLRAVANNAAWCDTVCRASGCGPSSSDDVWVNPDPSPPLFPNVISLAPSASGSALTAVLEVRDRLPGSWAVKDSFRSLELEGLGFEVLFDAEWLYRPFVGVDDVPGSWTLVADTRDLPEALLDDPEVGFFSTEGADVIANRAGGAVGLSNATGTGVDRACLAAVESLWPGLPLVGYAHGDELKAMIGLGFEPVGGLRVWVSS